MADDLELSVLEAPQAFAKDALVGELTTLICPGPEAWRNRGTAPSSPAETGDGVRAVLAGRYLAWVNFGEKPCRDEAFFAGNPGDEVPVFPGVTTLSGRGWRYRLQADALEGAILEPRGSLRISAGRPESPAAGRGGPGRRRLCDEPGEGKLERRVGDGAGAAQGDTQGR